MVTRAEHRQRTLRALSDAAVAVMHEHGPDAPLESIAERAGVTRRTIYRWVDARDNLVFIHPLLWLETFDVGVSEAGDVDVSTRIRAGSRRVCEVIDADPQPVLAAMRLAMKHPQLMRGYSAVSQQWIERMSTELATDSTDPADRFRSRVIGSAVMGVIDAALFEWSSPATTPPLWPLVESGLKHIDPILQPT